MRHILFTTFSLIITQAYALTCGDPVTIPNQQFDAAGPKLCINQNGDVAVIWISQKRSHEAITASLKQNSATEAAWSVPEFISDWEREGCYSHRCAFALNGNLIAIWKVDEQDVEDRIQLVEKKEDGCWTQPLNWNATIAIKEYTRQMMLDPLGNLVFLAQTEISKQIPNLSGKFYEKKIPGIAIGSQSSVEGEQKWDTSIADDDIYAIYDPCIVSNKKGEGYAFWVASAVGKRSLMYQKIQDGHFISNPETICLLDTYIHRLQAATNANGDIVLSYENSDSGHLIILTKKGSDWAQPFVFAAKAERFLWVISAIDEESNIFLVTGIDSEEGGKIKITYKPAGESWMEPVYFSSSNAECYCPEIKSDGNGQFVLIWQESLRRNVSIFGATFSTITRSWSMPTRLSPQNETCYAYSYNFWAPGKGYISWMNETPLSTVIQVAELSN